MDCDDDDDGPSFTGLDEVTRLHHEAFESLRTSTQTEEEDFLVRLRRWEEEKQEQARELSVSPTSMPPRAPPCSPQGPVARKSRDSGVGLDEVEEDECMLADQEEDEDDDDINIVLSSSPSPIKMATGSAHDARGRSRPGRLNLEVEELSRKLKNGAGLEDYRLVREYQERGRTGSRDSAASGGW